MAEVLAKAAKCKKKVGSHSKYRLVKVYLGVNHKDDGQGFNVRGKFSPWSIAKSMCSNL